MCRCCCCCGCDTSESKNWCARFWWITWELLKATLAVLILFAILYVAAETVDLALDQLLDQFALEPHLPPRWRRLRIR